MAVEATNAKFVESLQLHMIRQWVSMALYRKTVVERVKFVDYHGILNYLIFLLPIRGIWQVCFGSVVENY